MKALWQSSTFRRTALVLLAALLLGILVVGQMAQPVQAQTTNLALNKPVTCSSTESIAFPCSAAVDGNTGTRWSSAFSDPQWIRVDLGATYSISSVTLRWEAAYGRAFQIQVSSNASTWTTIYSTTTSTGGVQTIPVAGSGRYVRMYGTTRATQYGYSLFEFQVGGGTPPPTTPPPTTPPPTTPPPTTPPPSGNLAQGRPVTCSSIEHAGTPCAAAVDGNTGTRWASTFSDPQWIYVDLGATYSISRVVLLWEAAYGRSYQIQVAGSSGGPWSTIYSTTTGNGATDDLAVSGSGRYVRMNGTVRATSWGYSLWEFQVYSGGTPPPTTPPPTTPPPTPTRTPTPVPTTVTPPPGNIMLSYQAPAVASSVQNDANCSGCTADKVVDMNMATRWATAWSDPQWIYLDLGATATISRVVLKWEAAYARSYQIQVSGNASTWSNIYSTTTGDGATDDLTVSGSGRYVRLYATVRGTGYGYSLFEFEVYGTGGAPKPTPTPRPTSTPRGPWVLAWSDEFNGPGIDTSNWNYETGCTGYGNGEWQNYTNGANSSIVFDSQANSNVMIIEARQTSPTIAACNYTSSRMTTAGKREFTYGRIEARLKLPHTQGIWPAFWMMGNNITTGTPWPYNGEIDIMEHVGFPANTNITSGAVHGPGYSGGGNIGGQLVQSQAVNLNYHIYAVEWSPEGIKWFVDNNNFLNVTREQVETRGQWVFDHPFFILLNVAVGGAWPGPPDATSQFPQRMYVDYVRVYR